MTLLAVPFGVSTGRRGTLYGIGLGIVIALSYWIVISAFVAVGKGGLLPPVLAGWAPNILVASAAPIPFPDRPDLTTAPFASRGAISLSAAIRSLASSPCR